MVRHRQPFVQNGRLEHDAYLLLHLYGRAVLFFPIDDDLAPVGKKLGTEHGDRRTFPRAVHAEKGKQRPLAHRKRNVVDRLDLPERFA